MIKGASVLDSEVSGVGVQENDRRMGGEDMGGLVRLQLAARMDVRRVAGQRSKCGDPPDPRRRRRGMRFGWLEMMIWVRDHLLRTIWILEWRWHEHELWILSEARSRRSSSITWRRLGRIKSDMEDAGSSELQSAVYS